MTLDTRVDEMMDSIRGRLRAALSERGISLADASERAGLNRQYVSKLLRVKLSPTLDSVLRICLANGLEPIDVLLDPSVCQRVREAEVSGSTPPAESEEEVMMRALRQSFAARPRRKGRHDNPE